ATHNAIFVHRGILPLIRRVRSAAVATGIDFGLGFASRGTTLGNKGGIGIAFNLGATACVFVNSHFAAHQNNSRERNQNFRQIDNRLAAALRPHRARPASPPPPLTPGPTPNPDGGDPLIPTTTTAAKGGPQSRGEGGGLPPASLLEVFDRVVWAGDLNYRVSAPREVVDQLLEGNMHGALMANDQLIMATGSGEAFTGYLEGPLSFRPTYKFNPGSDVYDTSAKQRVPSWTDRVLYGGGKSKTGLELRAYRSVMQLRSSDHRPVLASFIMSFEGKEEGSSDDDLLVTNQTVSQVCVVM
ncbi:unnamed protein product, partial [Discosporangium mesarthrocarpum]